MPGRTWLASSVLLAAALAGCASPSQPGPTFSVPAPEWQPGHSWTFAADGVAPMTFEVALRHSFDGVEGVLGVRSGPPRPSVEFVSPALHRTAAVAVPGTAREACDAQLEDLELWNPPDWEVPWLRFPLEPGKAWRTVDDGSRVNEVRVAGLESVAVAAGTFEAVRLEVHAWFTSPLLAEVNRLDGTDEEGQRERGPVAVLHYAPDARSIVRVESPGYPATHAFPPAWLLSAGFVPRDGRTPEPRVTELMASSLEPGPVWTVRDLMDASWWGACTSQGPGEAP